MATVRFCGCNPDATTVKAHVFYAGGEWSEVPTCFVGDGLRFDKQKADALKITPELQLMREQSALDERAAARAAYPPPPRPEAARDGNQAQVEWNGNVVCFYQSPQFVFHLILLSRWQSYGSFVGAAGMAAFEARMNKF